jgi:Xaa-Pro dipeptidase
MRLGDLPPFLPAEYEVRLTRTRRAMERLRIDTLLVTTEANFRWLTGFTSQSWVSPTRPRFFVLPLSGDPVTIVPSGNRIGMRETSWVRDVRTWTAPCPEDDGISLVRDAIAATKAQTVGAELGPETRLGFPVLDYERLRAMLGPVRFVDASGLLAQARMLKSPAEIARIRFAAQSVSAGFVALAGSLRIGQSEREACRAFQIDLLQRGLDRSPYMVGASGPGGYESISTGPTDRVLQVGDLFIIDTGSTCDGYFCDFDRNYALGRTEGVAWDTCRRVWEATEAGLAAVRPGASMADLWMAMAKALGGRDAVGASNVGRMGHGLGLLLTEPPSVHPEDRTPLEPGMVITLEPGIGFLAEDGRRCVMVHEENLAVTNRGYELLSVRADPEPYRIGKT